MIEIINIDLDLIKTTKEFEIFKALDFNLIDEFKKKYPFTIDIAINKNKELIFDYSILNYYKKNKIKNVKAILFDDNYLENLFIIYNFRDKFFNVNNYEKLVFLNKILKYTNISQVYKKINLNLKINKDIINNIEKITDSCCKKVLIKDYISVEACNKIINFSQEDRNSVTKLFDLIKFSHSNQLKAIELLEEISFRDKMSIEKIINKLKPNILKEKKISEKEFMQNLLKLRYPIYTKYEKKWKKYLKSLKLKDNFRVNHYPFFEKNEIEFYAKFKSLEEFENFIKKLK